MSISRYIGQECADELKLHMLLGFLDPGAYSKCRSRQRVAPMLPSHLLLCPTMHRIVQPSKRQFMCRCNQEPRRSDTSRAVDLPSHQCLIFGDTLEESRHPRNQGLGCSPLELSPPSLVLVEECSEPLRIGSTLKRAEIVHRPRPRALTSRRLATPICPLGSLLSLPAARHASGALRG